MAMSVLQSSYKSSGLDVTVVVAVEHAGLPSRNHTRLSDLDRL
jgi:hypothetical protein